MVKCTSSGPLEGGTQARLRCSLRSATVCVWPHKSWLSAETIRYKRSIIFEHISDMHFLSLYMYSSFAVTQSQSLISDKWTNILRIIAEAERAVLALD
jgi:hypothetical protein